MKSLDNKEKRILLILPFFYPHVGGSQKYAEELHFKLIEKYSEFKVDVLCYNSKHVAKYEKYRNFNVYRIGCWEIIKDKFLLPNPLTLMFKLITLAKNRYDFVETHVRFFDPTWWVWMYAKLIGAKSIYVGHVPGHPAHHIRLVAWVGKLVDLTIAKFSLNRYDFIFYANRACKVFYESILKINKTGVVAHIGINPKDFESNQARELRKVPRTNTVLNTSQCLITFIGRMIETKGVMYLWEAILQLKEQLNDTEWDNLVFCFAGPGDLNERLEDLVKKTRLEDKILVLDTLGYEDTKLLLSYSNIFINPSSHDEGLPNTILEAGASGCFVITTKSGAIGDIIKEGKTGKVVTQRDPKDIASSINWYLKNIKEGQEISQNLKDELTNTYTWEKATESFKSTLTG